jgi:hypothetical protein
MVIVFDIYVTGKRMKSFGNKRDAESYVTVAKAMFSFDDSEIKIRKRAVA